MIKLFPVATYDGATMLHLDDEDVRDFHALPPLPKHEPEDFEAPDIIVTDAVTGRTWMVSRFSRGPEAYAEDITESWKAFLAAEGDLDEAEDGLNNLDVRLVLYPGEDDSPIVNATLLVCDNGAALVSEPPLSTEEAGGPMPTAEVYCITSQSFFDVIRCGDALMAFPTSPALRDADEA